MSIATPIYDDLTLDKLDFEPEILCDQEVHEAPVSADWWQHWTCGCVDAKCDACHLSDMRDHAVGVRFYCGRCQVDPVHIDTFEPVKR